ncbi:MAG: hypothetical protein C6I00_03615 [Nitratiruptor sp.]|nr:hypothetical protein [Nitratiruptor sp.]NPA83869.1 FAD-binding oxidoreductase [Campylobacterota bacterium]
MKVDLLIIGAGAAGAHCAYYLKKAGLRLLVVDQGGIAAGASGAAGAFIAPRLGRGGPLQRLTNQAFRESVAFYTRNFPHLFTQTGILRLPKDEGDAERFQGYLPFIDLPFRHLAPEDLPWLKPYARAFGGFLFPEGGIVEPRRVCAALLEGVPILREGIERIEEKGGGYLCNDIEAKRVIVATGAWGELLPPYLQLGRVGGYRIDVRASPQIPWSLHKRISISPPIGGRVAIGATHVRVDDPSHTPPPPNFLLEEARRMVELNRVEPLELLCGVRPSVFDHFPYAGEAIRWEEGACTPEKPLPRLRGLYLVGGFGGRGFVFAPFVAKRLVEQIRSATPLPPSIALDRLFWRWLKKRR